MKLGEAREQARRLLADPSALAENADAGAEREAAEKREQEERLVKSVGTRWVEQMRREGKRSADEVARTLQRHVYPEFGARSIETVTRSTRARECEVAQRIAGTPVVGFGASDCSCEAHLAYSPTKERLIASLRAAHGESTASHRE
jgi:hypothetical protein